MEDIKKEIYKKIQKFLIDESRQFENNLENIDSLLNELELNFINNKK